MTHGDLRDSQVQGPYYRQRNPNTKWLRIQTSFPPIGCQDSGSTQISIHFINDQQELTDVLTDFVASSNRLSQVAEAALFIPGDEGWELFV